MKEKNIRQNRIGDNSMQYDMIIIGAGAAGLAAAAYSALHHSELQILVLEKEKVPGRKLSASGNGKCNLTNRAFCADCYHTHNNEWMEQWTKAHSYMEILHFFEKIGILLYEKNGYVYPVSNQAKQVTELLYEESAGEGVRFLFQTRVSVILTPNRPKQDFYQIKADFPERESLCFMAKNVILCTGGKAAPALGGCTDGYKLASQIHMKQHPCHPVLCPIYVEDADLALAKGTRIDAVVSLRLEDHTILREAGQVQINDHCLSGIVIMNLSVYVEQERFSGEDCLTLDVVPYFTWDDLRNFWDRQQKLFPSMKTAAAMNGLLPAAFNTYILKRLKLSEGMRLEQMTEKQKNRLTSMLKKLTFTPAIRGQYDKAQATGGGIALEEVNVSSSETIRYPGLYICGEVLDADGKCGGYNLTFAILSGIQAASHILEKYSATIL